MLAKRAIVHLDLDTFFVAAERLRNRQLKGRPVIIGGHSNRGVVTSASYEARAFGVQAAMPMRMARMLCPDALVLRGDMEHYTQLSQLVTEVIREDAPVCEKASIDEFYIDATGLDRFFGCYEWSHELAKKVHRESGLPLSFCLSVNKTVAKIGTGENKPMGAYMVPNGTEREYIAPLSVAKIPMVGPKTSQQLVRMGVKTIHLLQQIPVRHLEKEFGQNGRVLSQKSQAIDPTPVVPYSEAKSISTEQTFARDTADRAPLRAALIRMAEKLAYQLRSKGQLTACVTVKIRYSDFNTETLQKRIAYCATDADLIRTVSELFERLYSRRLTLRLVGVRFSHLVAGHTQINLFDDTHKAVNLCQAMDRMKKRFGQRAVHRAITL